MCYINNLDWFSVASFVLSFKVLEKSREQRDRSLHNISMHILTWDIKVLKLKACFHTLNLLQREGTNFVAECWLPYSELATVQTVLDRSTVSTLPAALFSNFLKILYAEDKSVWKRYESSEVLLFILIAHYVTWEWGIAVPYSMKRGDKRGFINFQIYAYTW